MFKLGHIINKQGYGLDREGHGNAVKVCTAFYCLLAFVLAYSA